MPEQSLAKVTALPELKSTTESEQMYLITVARAVEGGAVGPVPISRVASALGVSVPSANEMVRKLDSRGLLLYEPYRGVLLSHVGQQVADQVLRTRRLWATFLAEHLGFSPADADDQACHLEHATTPEAADSLAAFLGNPEAGPLGRPIPRVDAAGHRPPTSRLDEIPVGATAEVISVTASGPTLQFLNSEGIRAGVHLAVVAAGSTGLLVDLNGNAVHINGPLAESVEVRPMGGVDAPA
ncbi:MAG: metal-dependent transcriptional regulator [Acidimicrobiia bacterium]|nr:metal-dependent transcriptional regulator [Acidimicrobiia bacterium]